MTLVYKKICIRDYGLLHSDLASAIIRIMPHLHPRAVLTVPGKAQILFMKISLLFTENKELKTETLANNDA